MTTDTVVVLNWYTAPFVVIAHAGHVHHTDGTCMKRRQGPQCTPTQAAIA